MAKHISICFVISLLYFIGRIYEEVLNQLLDELKQVYTETGKGSRHFKQRNEYKKYLHKE